MFVLDKVKEKKVKAGFETEIDTIIAFKETGKEKKNMKRSTS